MSAQFIEYLLEDGTSILVQAPSDLSETGPIKTGVEQQGVIQAEKTFGEALEGVRKQAKELRKKLEDVRADEVEVKFSLTATGELGNFAIGKVGIEASYEVTLKWTNKPQTPK